VSYFGQITVQLIFQNGGFDIICIFVAYVVMYIYAMNIYSTLKWVLYFFI